MHTTPQNPVKSDHLYVKYCSWIIDRQPDKSNEQTEGHSFQNLLHSIENENVLVAILPKCAGFNY